MFLIGQKENKKLIDENKLDNTNFIIIKGPADYGKSYLAKYIANHYNMNYIELDNKVATVRDLVESSTYENNCVYHFKDFENSSMAAKAALLKLAEETPNGIKIIITTSSSNILQTLTSRAYVLSMETYLDEDLIQYTNTLNFDLKIYNRLKNFNVNITPSLLYKYKKREDINEIIDIVEDTFNRIEKGLNLEDICTISNKFWKDDQDRLNIFLNILATACLDLTNNKFKTLCCIEQTLYLLKVTTITNYKLLINNMLMEVV